MEDPRCHRVTGGVRRERDRRVADSAALPAVRRDPSSSGCRLLRKRGQLCRTAACFVDVRFDVPLVTDGTVCHD